MTSEDRKRISEELQEWEKQVARSKAKARANRDRYFLKGIANIFKG